MKLAKEFYFYDGNLKYLKKWKKTVYIFILSNDQAY